MTLRDTWSLYESGWNIADPAQRLAILRQALDLDFIYCDPVARTQGHHDLSRYISEVHKKVPGMRINTQSYEEHHDACLVKWTMADGKSAVLAQGATCAEVGHNNLLKKATVFYATRA